MMTPARQQPVMWKSGHAVVIGGSIAGLMAARILADHFETVTVVERESLNDHNPSSPPQKPEPHGGVSQANNVHVPLAQGQRILEYLFPGLAIELSLVGAPTINWTADCPVLGVGVRFQADLATHTCSHRLFEWSIRRRLMDHYGVNFLAACQVTQLRLDDSQARVTGVQVLQQGGAEEDKLAADLVVDARGCHSSLPQWLETLGYPSPEETAINSFLGYSTCWFKRPQNFQADWKVLMISHKPPKNKRAGVIYPVEGDRWVVVLSSVGHDSLPTDQGSFLEFAQSLQSPLLYEAIKDASSLSPVQTYGHIENRRRHYEKLSRLPEGLMALGDAVCAVNPFYGQKMTVAALGALTLDTCLKQQAQPEAKLSGLSKRFQTKLASTLETPWLIALSEDFRWSTTEGNQPGSMLRLMNQYMNQVSKSAIGRPGVWQLQPDRTQSQSSWSPTIGT